MAGYRTLHLDDIPTVRFADDAALPNWKPVRHTLGIEAFGTNAYVGEQPGDVVIERHDELPDAGEQPHQELYLVLGGSARFTVDGETFEVPSRRHRLPRGPDAGPRGGRRRATDRRLRRRRPGRRRVHAVALGGALPRRGRRELGAADAHAVRAPGPAAGPALTLLQLFPRAPDAALPGLCCLASSTQQMNSLRASGVMSFQASSAVALTISAARRSGGAHAPPRRGRSRSSPADGMPQCEGPTRALVRDQALAGELLAGLGEREVRAAAGSRRTSRGRRRRSPRRVRARASASRRTRPGTRLRRRRRPRRPRALSCSLTSASTSSARRN